MRRIYESDALHRDEDPHTPSETDAQGPGRTITANQNTSLLNWGALTRRLLPAWLVDRAVAVSVETDRTVYEPDDPVGIRVRIRNRLPMPVAIRTPTRRRWDWTIDGRRRAEGEGYERIPEEASTLSFHRGETKTFTRTWHQRFRTAGDRWTPAETGTYEVAAFVDVADPARRGLRATTEIEIRD